MGDVLVAEVLDRRGHGADCSVAQRTEGTTKNVVGDVEQGFDVLLIALAALVYLVVAVLRPEKF